MRVFKLISATLLLGLIAWLTAGCAHGTRHHSSSVVNYLYPDNVEVKESVRLTRLSLPARVGVAMVPETQGYNPQFSEVERERLLESIREEFREQEFVGSIQVIPSAYLVRGGSFTNLEQISRLYNVDVIALVSFDQTQFTDSGIASLSYWTLVGAYLVPGEKNDTHTMMDATVYDIQSRAMLFRAPGVSHIKGRATPVNLSEQLRNDSLEGFEQASAQLEVNLAKELEEFKLRLREAPEQYEVVHRGGYTGGGSVDALFLVMLSIGLGYGMTRFRILAA